MHDKETVLGDMARAVVDMDEAGAVRLAETSIELGVDAYTGINDGLVKGMNVVGEKYDNEEYFIPELLLCSDAMTAGIEVLRPHLPVKEQAVKEKIVIGVIQGDTHDIGKNLVKIMLETSGFEVIDLGRDVAPRTFVDTAVEVDARLIGLSTLMTTTMGRMEEVIQILEDEGIRDRFRVMVGGEPVSRGFAERIGADAYALNGTEAARTALELVATF
ncbi:MAG: cobalamin-binding protein [Desulfobacteraceae bacterium]|nr:cobalamin-binding protein [Desulfobacteraceae bacterium]